MCEYFKFFAWRIKSSGAINRTSLDGYPFIVPITLWENIKELPVTSSPKTFEQLNFVAIFTAFDISSAWLSPTTFILD